MTSSGKKTCVTFNPDTSKYIVKYDGKSIETTVADNYDVADAWVRKYFQNMEKARVVGLATMGLKQVPITPINRKGYKVVTLQLYIDEKCLILKLLDMESCPYYLKGFFRNCRFIFAGIQDERRNDFLCNECGFRITNSLDIVEAARMRWPTKFMNTYLKVLAREVANVHFERPAHIIQSNWETTMLCLEQVEFATMEAYASYCVGHKLLIGD